MKAAGRFPRHFAARHGTPCGRPPSPRQPVRGKACKRTNGFWTRKVSNQKKKSVRSPVFPRLPHSRKLLCGRKFASLRQERNFFQQRNSVFAARKRPPRRRNAPYGQFPPPFFNNSGPISVLPLLREDAEEGGNPYFLTENPGIWRHFQKSLTWALTPQARWASSPFRRGGWGYALSIVRKSMLYDVVFFLPEGSGEDRLLSFPLLVREKPIRIPVCISCH